MDDKFAPVFFIILALLFIIIIIAILYSNRESFSREREPTPCRKPVDKYTRNILLVGFWIIVMGIIVGILLEKIEPCSINILFWIFFILIIFAI